MGQGSKRTFERMKYGHRSTTYVNGPLALAWAGSSNEMAGDDDDDDDDDDDEVEEVVVVVEASVVCRLIV